MAWNFQTSSTLDMNRRETVLSMGYLVKSPTRSNDKSNLPMFWKLRWCVFAKVCFSDRFGIVQDTKFILSYYDDKQTHFNDQRPKGKLAFLNLFILHPPFSPLLRTKPLYTHILPFLCFLFRPFHLIINVILLKISRLSSTSWILS